jgi:hypothetical protein
VVGGAIGRAAVRPAAALLIAVCGAGLAASAAAWSDGVWDPATARESVTTEAASREVGLSGLREQVRASVASVAVSSGEREPIEALRSVAASRWAELRAEAEVMWAGVPDQSRGRLARAALGGALTGLLLGLVAPRRMLAVSTAAVGSACLVVAVAALGASGDIPLRLGPSRAVAAWAVVAALGASWQWPGSSARRITPTPCQPATA